LTRFVGILSGKGGVAKTTTVLGLGSAMNYFGRDVVVVDGNLSTPNIGLHLGVPVFPITLHDVLKGKNHISEAVYLHPSGLKIIPAGLSIADLKDVNPDNLAKVLPYLDGLTDVVLVDGSAGLGREALAVMNAVDDIIVVTNPELPAVTDALKTIKIAEDMGKYVKGVVVAKSGEGEGLGLESVEAMLDKKILGVIPYDRAVKESLKKKEPVVYSHPKSKSAIAYKKLAADLMGIEFNERAELGFTSFLRKIGLWK
jgi:septum site-determining protein MinD